MPVVRLSLAHATAGSGMPACHGQPPRNLCCVASAQDTWRLHALALQVPRPKPDGGTSKYA
eukprot:58503-Chlamydomonas_euryale.AAC.8